MPNHNTSSVLNSLQQIKPGDHVCLIYDSDEDHRNVLVPYVRQGLETNQKILFVTGQPTAEAIIEYLDQDADFSVRTFLENGQLLALSSKEAYFDNGEFDPDKMIAMLAAETDRAIAEGYAALRITGEMSWALGDVIGADRLIEYEIKLNDFYPGSRALTICQYDTRRFSPEVIMKVLQAHPKAILGTAYCDNLYYLPPEELLSDSAQTYQMRRWIENLKRFQAEREALQSAIQEKKHLMRELHHRVKNNLALVSSLIRLKERSTGTLPDQFADVHGFVQSIMLTHTTLDHDGDDSMIDFSQYARDLVQNLVVVHNGTPVDIRYTVPETKLDAETGKNLGLIINELVTNAMKHGFNGQQDPRIEIELTTDTSSDRYVLTVSNNGNPIPEHVTLDDPSTGGIGLNLILSFVDNLRGSIDLTRKPHPRFRIQFPRRRG